MSLLSMTGFGKFESIIQNIETSIEIKSVNGRHLEVVVRSPKELNFLETQIKQLLAQHLSRGSVSVHINIGKNSVGNIPTGINKEFIEKYISLAQEIKDNYNVSGDLDINTLVKHQETFFFNQNDLDWEAFGKSLLEGLQVACNGLIKMRAEEGAHLTQDLQSRIEKIKAWLVEIENMLPTRLEEYQKRLHEKLNSFIEDFGELDPMRLHQEVAYLADRIDVTEEITRFASHNQLFLKTLEQGGAQGKRLNFLLQEMGREANTLTTKSHFVEIQHRAVSIKEELEILREQVANIE